MKKRIKIIIPVFFIISLVSVVMLKALQSNRNDVVITEIKPVKGNIVESISTNGTVLPKNRLELKPSVSGRIEKVFVEEGDLVKIGQVLALMSSTDRAALIDAARLEGPASVKYWENAYKEIPIVAPINGTVIVRDIEPGQTVAGSDNIIIISDRLIIQAQFDETDIGKISEGQAATITLDALPEITVKGAVYHIYHESYNVNNVTVYFVTIIPESVPDEFRSGMSASVEIEYKKSENTILVPVGAVLSDSSGEYVLMKNEESSTPQKRAVTLGISNDTLVEITEGISSDDVLVTLNKKIELENENSETNPFVTEKSQEKPPNRPEPPQTNGSGPGGGKR